MAINLNRVTVENRSVQCQHNMQLYNKKGKGVPYSVTIVGAGADL